ncbi:MAG: hypothetical protein QXU13_06380 [Desulfurococcaceae archaeon]
MCRLLAMYVTRNNLDHAKAFLHAFVESNKYDPYLEKASKGAIVSHDDGWGIVVVGYVDNTPSVISNKVLNPIFDEYSKRLMDLIINRLKGYEEVYLLIHARKASRKEPYGVEYLHPFMYLAENGAMWFAHNGGAYKEKLAKQFGVYPWIRVDSELLGYFVMNNVEECIGKGNDMDKCLSETYKLAKDYVVERSALNTGLLFLHNRDSYLYVTHWIKGIVEDDLRNYYLFMRYVSNGIVAMGSISIIEYLDIDAKKHVELVEPGVYKVHRNNVTMIGQL